MHLNHLRHLVALAEHQSFRKAAEALFLTQPALSRSIQALEQELGVKLVDRDGKRNTLTAYGALVAERAKRIVFEVKELKRGVELLQAGQLGTLNVGLGPTPAAILTSPFLTHMASHHPRMQVKIARGSVDLLVQALRNESIDIAAVDRRALVPADDLAIEPAIRLRGGFMGRSGHPLTTRALIDLTALRQFPVASTPLSDELARRLVEQLGPDARAGGGDGVEDGFIRCRLRLRWPASGSAVISGCRGLPPTRWSACWSRRWPASKPRPADSGWCRMPRIR